MPTDQLHHQDKLTIPLNDIIASVPTFPTKKAAITAGRAFGWGTAVRATRRFETVWLVGQRLLANPEVAGVSREEFRLPLLRWETRCGVQHCPVLRVHRTPTSFPVSSSPEV